MLLSALFLDLILDMHLEQQAKPDNNELKEFFNIVGWVTVKYHNTACSNHFNLLSEVVREKAE